MNLNFSDFNFHVIEVATPGIAELVVNKNTINFSQKVADEIGNPPFVKILADTDKNVLAIQACKATDANAVKFSKPRGEQKGGVIVSRTVVRSILKTMMCERWDEKHRYKIPAKIFTDSKVAVFYLDVAVEHELYNVHRHNENKG